MCNGVWNNWITKHPQQVDGQDTLRGAQEVPEPAERPEERVHIRSESACEKNKIKNIMQEIHQVCTSFTAQPVHFHEHSSPIMQLELLTHVYGSVRLRAGPGSPVTRKKQELKRDERGNS